MAVSATTARSTTSGYTVSPETRMENEIDEAINAAAYIGKNAAAYFRPPATSDVAWAGIKNTYTLAGYTIADVPVGDGTFVPPADAFELQWPDANNVIIR